MSNEETRATFIARAQIVSGIRRFLDGEGFIEVETPILQPLYGGALAKPFETHFNALDRTMYLRIATELYLKRLIVGGLERVYEIGKNFRNEGLSPKHNPEFTVLEWYEAYADWEVVADRCERLVRYVAQLVGRSLRPALAPGDARRLDRDPHRRRHPRQPYAGGAPAGDAREGPARPRGRADLARAGGPPGLQVRRADADRADAPARLPDRALAAGEEAPRASTALVERFEAFADGMEFVNAFSELNDPDDQRARFEGSTSAMPRPATTRRSRYDEELTRSSLEQGMPLTGGIGIGIDRLRR